MQEQKFPGNLQDLSEFDLKYSSISFQLKHSRYHFDVKNNYSACGDSDESGGMMVVAISYAWCVHIVIHYLLTYGNKL